MNWEQATLEFSAHFKVWQVTTKANYDGFVLVRAVPGRVAVADLYNLLYLDERYYLLLHSPSGELPLLDFVRCRECSKWVKVTTPAGAQHLDACVRCATCRKRLRPEEEHVCRMLALRAADVAEQRHKYHQAGLTKALARGRQIDWDTRVDVMYADFETFTSPVQSTFTVYAAGLLQQGSGAEPRIFYGPRALDQFMETLLALPVSVTLLFWNGSRFDLIPIIAWLQARGDTIASEDILKRQNRVLSLTFRGQAPGVAICVRDAYLMIPESLANACKSYKVPAALAKGEFDHAKIRSWEDAADYEAEVSSYLRKDVLSLQYIYRAFAEQILAMYTLDCVQFLTISHLSVNAWQSVTPVSRNVIIPSPAEYYRFRGVIRGGRVQPQVPSWTTTQSLTTPYAELTDYKKMYDANSLYPYAMSTHEYPVGWYDISEDPARLAARLRDLYNGASAASIYHSILLVDVTCPNDLLTPFLPSRYPDGGLAYDLYPKVREYYLGFELMHALRLGYVVQKIHAEWRWSSRADYLHVFYDYIEQNYALRQQHASGTVQNSVAKLCMNSVFGKMIQRLVTTDTTLIAAADIDGLDALLARQPGATVKTIMGPDNQASGWLVNSEKPGSKVAHPFYYGAAILAHSRVHMSEFLLLLDGYRDPRGAFLYTDTDSLIVDGQTAEARIPASWRGDGVLGQFKDDLKGYGRIVKFAALAPKTYALVYRRTDETLWLKIRCKGIPHTSDPIAVTAEELESAHDPALALRVHAVERAMRQGQAQPAYVDARFRAYVARSKDGTERVTRYLSITSFELILTEELTSLVAFYGTMKVHYDGGQGRGLSITPQYQQRSLADITREGWWKRGKRYFTPSFPQLSVPPGHYAAPPPPRPGEALPPHSPPDSPRDVDAEEAY